MSRLLEYRSKRRVQRRRYVRFYGRYQNHMGRTKGFEFQVRAGGRMPPRALHKLVRHTCGKMKYESALPVHRIGESFSSFAALFGSDWIRIRKLYDYDVSVHS